MNIAEAVKIAVDGKEEGFNYLYEMTYQKSYYIAIKYMKNEDAAMDVLQDAYVKAFKNLEQLEDASKFESWFARIVATKALDELKKKSPILFSQMENEDNNASPVEMFEDDRTENQPELMMDKSETTRLVKEMIDTLSDEQRMCILMYYAEEMSVREIADTLGVSENTVKSRLNYGRKSIKEKVLDLEKKGTKLYGLAPIAFFTYLLAAEAKTVSAQVVPTASASVVAMASKEAAKTVASITIKKAIAGAVAVAVVGTGAAGIIYKTQSNKTKKEPVTTQVEYYTLEYVDPANILYEGTSGDLKWSIDVDGCLRIAGTGDYELLQDSEYSHIMLPIWNDCAEYVTNARINVHGISSAKSMFEGLNKLESIEFIHFDTSNVTDMTSMFAGCDNLRSLDVSNFNTSKVTDMSAMFDWCEKLEYLDVSNFDTSNVTTMEFMFAGCENLKEIDVSGFDTSNVIDMRSMFYNCRSLTSLDVSNFKTSNVTDMNSMFEMCDAITNLNLSNFDTSKVIYMGSMFNFCGSLTSLDLSNFDTSKVKNMSHMFAYCIELESVDVSNFNTSNVETMESMFESCRNLTTVDVSGFDISNVTEMDWMFYDCGGLKDVDLSRYETEETKY